MNDNGANTNSRRLARTWPYPRHVRYQRDLRKIAAAWFEKKGFAVHHKYPFVLQDWNDWPRNIVVPEVADYIKRIRGEREAAGQVFPLHKYIHHGLSSQAMVFNLIGPMIVNGEYAPLRNAMEKVGLVWPADTSTVEFEYEDREVFNEDSGQPTSIDLLIGNPDGQALFVESKLVEKEFGGCSLFSSGDCDGRNPASDMSQCYLHHIGRKYWTLLEKHGFLNGPMSEERQCLLTAHYQFFREVLFALEKGGTFVLLCDERSPTFFCKGEPGIRGLMPFLMDFVPSDLRNRIGSVTIQQVADEIEKAGDSDWIGDFKEKYGLTSA